jgi:hypothetical protein
MLLNVVLPISGNVIFSEKTESIFLSSYYPVDNILITMQVGICVFVFDIMLCNG